MILSKKNLSSIPKENLVAPNDDLFNLPEKVLQFGTGVLLRGLPDYFINKANLQGIFNGRVAVVKSTGVNTSAFDEQDSLYTLCIRGIANGEPVAQNIISSAISRVIAATEDWQSVLAIAQSEDLQLIVSNTTEVGIQLVNESISLSPPKSFPAKLLAVLHHRYKAFKSGKGSGLVIIATELIPDNGKKLASIVVELANWNELGTDFLCWLHTENIFCNSLVDRIVPGKPDPVTLTSLENELGYTDQLLSMAEPYRLWAIEGNDRVRKVLSFSQVDDGVVIADDIEIYRELKVRLLNGTHTLTSGIAYLAGIDTVKSAMQNEQIKTYIDALMATEISPAIPHQVTTEQTTAFAATVKDRFENPSIEHLWLNITFQYTMKMKIRILPLLLNYYKKCDRVPVNIAFGFAAYLVFMRVDKKVGDKYYGLSNGMSYLITDDNIAYFYEKANDENYVTSALCDRDFWKSNLNSLPGFVDAVKEKYDDIVNNGTFKALSGLNIDKLTRS